jgi:hypothetical protein
MLKTFQTSSLIMEYNIIYYDGFLYIAFRKY